MKAALKSIIALALLVSISWFFVPHAQATAYSPPAGNDADSGVDGVCRLIEILTAINNGAGYNECLAPSGSDTINLPTGTITLTADLPTVVLGAGDNLTVDGAGMGTSIIDGADAYAGFYFQIVSVFSPIPNVAVSDFRMTNLSLNNSQGALRFLNMNAEVSDVEIDSSYFDGLSAVRAYIMDTSGATLNYDINLNDLYLHNNSGDSIGSIFVVDSSSNISDNHTVNVDINRVSINDNSGTATNWGIIIGSDNIYSTSIFDFSITNSTIYQPGTNSIGVYLSSSPEASSSGVSLVDGSIINSTIIGNDTSFAGSGIFAAASAGAGVGSTATTTIYLQNNIIANNTSSSVIYNCQTWSGGAGSTVTITSLGNNLSDDATCGTAQPSDLYSQSTSAITSTLGPLQDNGGLTPTMALLAGSPAIDAGATVGAITADQRSVARPQGSAYDIGAYELVSTLQPGGSNQTQGQSGLTLPRVGVVLLVPFLASPLVMLGYIFIDFRRKSKARVTAISHRIISGNRVILPLAVFVKRQRRRVDGLYRK